MSATYEGALEAAGATIHQFREFGSYQGDWWAKVTLKDGRTGWINGSYGSCSGCDAIQAEFDYDRDKCEDHRWNWNFDASTCSKCVIEKGKYDERLISFGASYLDGIMSQEEAEERAGRNVSWDSDAPDMLKFIKENPVG